MKFTAVTLFFLYSVSSWAELVFLSEGPSTKVPPALQKYLEALVENQCAKNLPPVRVESVEANGSRLNHDEPYVTNYVITSRYTYPYSGGDIGLEISVEHNGDGTLDYKVVRVRSIGSNRAHCAPIQFD